MFLMQYTHRLPADYDMGRIRERAAKRGPDWDAFPGLIFKGFLIRERGKHGAASNAYSSLYLWNDAEAAAKMITGERFQAVIDAFGRPNVESFLVLAASFGPARSARFVQRSDEFAAADLDLAALKESELRNAQRRVQDEAAFAAITALDVTGWRLARFVLSAAQPSFTHEPAVSYEMGYLAQS